MKQLSKWWNKLLSRPYEEAVNSVQQQVSGISEPVLSIVKTFDEKGRWEFYPTYSEFDKLAKNNYPYDAYDRKLGQVYKLQFVEDYSITGYPSSKCMPKHLRLSSLPNWLSFKEKQYIAYEVNKRLERLYKVACRYKRLQTYRLEKIRVAALQQERTRMMGLYCKEE